MCYLRGGVASLVLRQMLGMDFVIELKLLSSKGGMLSSMYNKTTFETGQHDFRAAFKSFRNPSVSSIIKSLEPSKSFTYMLEGQMRCYVEKCPTATKMSTSNL